MKEEDEIMKKLGKDNPFTVPEGYFQNFTDEVMNKLPEKKEIPTETKVRKWDRIRPWVYMAAMFAGAFLITKIASFHHQQDNPIAKTETKTEQQMSDEEISTIINNTMMDDYALYQYLTDATEVAP